MARKSLAIIVPLCLVACSESPEKHSPQDVLRNTIEVGDDQPWTDVDPNRVFSLDLNVESLDLPSNMKGARLGFFSDPSMIRQYTAKQLDHMKADQADFVVKLDLDSDGTTETYRTGFWEKPDGRKGTFLAVSDVRHGNRAVDTSDGNVEGIFLSWHGNGLVVSGCNCRWMGHVGYHARKITVRWN